MYFVGRSKHVSVEKVYRAALALRSEEVISESSTKLDCDFIVIMQEQRLNYRLFFLMAWYQRNKPVAIWGQADPSKNHGAFWWYMRRTDANENGI